MTCTWLEMAASQGSDRSFSRSGPDVILKLRVIRCDSWMGCFILTKPRF